MRASQAPSSHAHQSSIPIPVQQAPAAPTQQQPYMHPGAPMYPYPPMHHPYGAPYPGFMVNGYMQPNAANAAPPPIVTHGPPLGMDAPDHGPIPSRKEQSTAKSASSAAAAQQQGPYEMPIEAVQVGYVLKKAEDPTDRLKAERRLATRAATDDIVNWRQAKALSIIQILFGTSLFALGLARLLLMSIWGLGIELVYGVYVIVTGILGLVGARRMHFCCLIAAFVMSALSCLLAIPPFVTGLLATVPDTFKSVNPALFRSSTEPYGVDVIMSVICLLQLITAIVMATMGCKAAGRSLQSFSDERIRPQEIGASNANFESTKKTEKNANADMHDKKYERDMHDKK